LRSVLALTFSLEIIMDNEQTTTIPVPTEELSEQDKARWEEVFRPEFPFDTP